MFSTMPVLNLGVSTLNTEILTHLGSRDKMRIEAALDCFVVSHLAQGLEGFSKLSVKVMGRMTDPEIPPTGNFGVWPGFDTAKISFFSGKISALIKDIEPHLRPNALSVAPSYPSQKQKMLQFVGQRLILNRQYDLPLKMSGHKTMMAQRWIKDQFPSS